MLHRRERGEIGADRQHVVARHLGVVRDRASPDRAAAVRAACRRCNGVDELVVGPVADAGLAVRRDVGRDNDAERRLDRPAAGEGLAARLGVAGGAIAERREIAAALDLLEVLRGRRLPPMAVPAAAEQAPISNEYMSRDRYAWTSGPGS